MTAISDLQTLEAVELLAPLGTPLVNWAFHRSQA